MVTDGVVGALALVGSGEYLPVMEPVEAALLTEGIRRGKRNTFIQIPTAAGRESVDRLAYWRQIGLEQANRLATEQVFLPVYSREDAFNLEHAKAIDEAGLIYLSGGDPGYLAQALAGTPVWAAIERNWRFGSSLAGCSAGAMAMGSDVPNFRKMKEEGQPGLSIISHIRTIPHYNKFFGWIPDGAAKVMLKAPEGTIIIGIDEGTALVTGLEPESSFENRTWSVHGVGGVHILRGAPTHRYQSGDRISL
ncbi:MAG: Type 1 glutamine amidotransferase-like domain-containing protein [Actinomycetes bacterium]